MEINQYSNEYEEQYIQLYIDTWKAEPYGEKFIKENISNHLVKNSGYLFLLVEKNEVIGFVGGRPLNHFCDFYNDEQLIKKVNTEKAFYIDELGVKIEFRKLGLGTLLTNFLISNARSKGYNEFVLRTHRSYSNPALKLYFNLGFNPRTLQNGEAHLVDTLQTRIDDRPDIDSRVYFYRTYKEVR